MDIDKDPLVLNDDFRHALDLLEQSNANIFLTGRAGTGKSTLLQLFRDTTKKKTVVVAPTGVAALNVRGQTIHSFFGFPPRLIGSEDIKKRRFRKLYEQMEVLVIDEISMVRADLVDAMDHFLQLNRGSFEPFGGVQVVFIGDLFQLPPVVASEAERNLFQTVYESQYFFSAHVFQEGFQMQMVELKQVFRQDSRYFLRLLEAIRLNRSDRDDLEALNQRCVPDFQSVDFYITLSARNRTVQQINQQEISQLNTYSHTYQATVTGNFNPLLFPTEASLTLKEGAQVLFLKNDPDKRYVNGSIGKVVELTNDKAKVSIEEKNGVSRLIDVEPVEWEIIKYKTPGEEDGKIETEVVGTFRQLPLKLAWAITIHKAQGKTFDKVIIDMGSGAFEHGQAYVALSRCRTLEGIVLRRPLQARDILVDPRVVEFYELQRR